MSLKKIEKNRKVFLLPQQLNNKVMGVFSALVTNYLLHHSDIWKPKLSVLDKSPIIQWNNFCSENFTVQVYKQSWYIKQKMEKDKKRRDTGKLYNTTWHHSFIKK